MHYSQYVLHNMLKPKLNKTTKNCVKHVCDTCGKSYETKSALNYHLRWICASLERFQCDQCPYRAKRYYCFKEHLIRKHRIRALDKHCYLKNTT